MIEDLSCDDGALVYYLDNEGKKCSITLSSKRPDLHLEFVDNQWFLKLGSLARFIVHNESGPAILRDPDNAGRFQSRFLWIQNGRIHNTSGAAIIGGSGNRDFYLYGFKFSKDEWDGIQAEKLDYIYTRHGILKFYKSGTKIIHRDGGPATYCDRPDKKYHSWYRNGIIHRDNDLPAHTSVDSDGITRRFWFVSGHMHRDTGPAIERSDGNNEYALDNVRMSQEQFLEKVGALRKGQRLKKRAAGLSAHQWKAYLDKVESIYRNRIASGEANADRCKRLLANFVSRKREESAVEKFAEFESEFSKLGQYDKKQVIASIHKISRRLTKILKKFPDRRLIHLKLSLLIDRIEAENAVEQNEKPLEEVEISLTIDPPTTKEHDATPSFNVSFGAVAAACLTIAGLCGLSARSKKHHQEDKEYKIEV